MNCQKDRRSASGLGRNWTIVSVLDPLWSCALFWVATLGGGLILDSKAPSAPAPPPPPILTACAHFTHEVARRGLLPHFDLPPLCLARRLWRVSASGRPVCLPSLLWGNCFATLRASPSGPLRPSVPPSVLCPGRAPARSFVRLRPLAASVDRRPRRRRSRHPIRQWAPLGARQEPE